MTTVRARGFRSLRARCLVLLAVPWVALTHAPNGAANVPAAGLRIRVTEAEPPAGVPRHGALEIDFAIDNSTAVRTHWPYDPSPPHGIPRGAGISADGIFVDPHGREYRQPAFQYQRFLSAVHDGRDWDYPTGEFTWKLRFSPNQVGTWKYRIAARDASGTAETDWRTLTVRSSSSRGFIRVSKADPRYFEFENGTLFSGLGFQVPEYLEDPRTRGAAAYRELESYGINFARLWIGSLYGSAWTPYVGGRNRYAGYLPVTGLLPVQDDGSRKFLALRIDQEPSGDSGWFDACRLQWANDPEAVKPNTRYRVRATYRAAKVEGPRNPRVPGFGFVVKLGGMFPNCHEPGTSRRVTPHGANVSGWKAIEGLWQSGERYFLPKLHLALENATRGAVDIRSVSVREILPDGTDGPEILARPSLQFDEYIPQVRAHAFDQVVRLAERHGVYLKVVLMEKDDEIYRKLEDSGDFVTSRDNASGVYGTGRSVNRTRWLQQAWWRYVQARWGYSSSVHSWELLNEGDPASRRHYELADEFGKFMHYGVFGVRPTAGYDHPNDHLVTTSFWHSFPAAEFWGNPKYPHVDYADLHAYVSTSPAPPAEKERMRGDAAYFHTWHSQQVAAARIAKPVVRGEAGLDVPGRQDETALGLDRDTAGTWLHNFLWAGLDAGGLYELYWWRSHIWNKKVDHRPTYRLLSMFLSDLDLHKGGYADWDGTVTPGGLRVVGQKNLTSGSMHLWIQNLHHSWKNVADRRPIPPASGTITVPGFKPGAGYQFEWWDTHAPAKRVTEERIVADRSGDLRFRVSDLHTDVALKVRRLSGRGPVSSKGAL